MFSIYIHIPFCLKKCPYCDFYSTTLAPDKIPQKEYADAVCKEIEQQAARYGLGDRKVDTIYFGGGTPTILEPWALEAILNAVHKHFSVTDGAEITIEANPETLVPFTTTLSPACPERSRGSGRGEGVRGLLNLGINRLSIGIQTFNERHLQALGRIHSAETAINAARLAQGAGFANISIDLMWGLPEQKIEDLELDLEKAVALSPQHLSAYQLTTDKFTNLPDEDLAREMFILVHNKLTSAGYEHYEISNFAKKGARCLHNLNYWHYGEWLGVGTSASSFLACHCACPPVFWREPKGRSNPVDIRLTSTKDIDRYLRYDFSYEIEPIDQKTAMAEYCFLGLRTSDGINTDDFKSRFGIKFDDAYPNLRQEWMQNGFAVTYELKNLKTYKLTLNGWLISDELFTKFII